MIPVNSVCALPSLIFLIFLKVLCLIQDRPVVFDLMEFIKPSHFKGRYNWSWMLCKINFIFSCIIAYYTLYTSRLVDWISTSHSNKGSCKMELHSRYFGGYTAVTVTGVLYSIPLKYTKHYSTLQ